MQEIIDLNYFHNLATIYAIRKRCPDNKRSYGTKLIFYFYELSHFASDFENRGGTLSAGRTRAESHLKRIPKRTRAPAPAHRLQRYKLAPSAAPACIGVLCALYCSAHTVPDTNRYVAGLPSFQGCSARSPRADSVRAIAISGRRVNKPFSARNASSHPAGIRYARS